MLQPVRRESSPLCIALVAAIAKIPLESVAATDATASPHTAQGTDPNAESPQGYRRRRVHLSRHRRGFQIGRAHVLPPVTNAHLVCRLLLKTKTCNIYNFS